MKPGTIITFTGGREFDHPRGPTGFNAARYRWVKKKMDRFDVCPGADETVVYSVGTLYGEWIDGTPFEGNRYVDRFVVQGRPDREDGRLERQRRADFGAARDRGVPRVIRRSVQRSSMSHAHRDRSRARMTAALPRPTTFGIFTTRSLVAFIGIGRQNIQQIAAALRGGRHQRAVGHRIQMAVHQAHHLGSRRP